MKRFIGITGIQVKKEIEELAILAQSITPHDLVLHAGYILTAEMVRGGEEHPRGISLKIMEECMRVESTSIKHVIHFSCNGTESDIVQDIDTVFSYKNIYTRGLVSTIQLNDLFVDQEAVVHKLAQKYPDLEIIYVLHNSVLSKGNSYMLDTLRRVKNSIDGLLFDVSGGTGRTLIINKYTKALSTIRDSIILKDVSIGFAGGLSAENIEEKIDELLSFGFSQCSIDAESGLRDSNDALDMPKMKLYIQRAVKKMQLTRFSE